MSSSDFMSYVNLLFSNFGKFLAFELPVKGLTVGGVFAGSLAIVLGINLLTELFSHLEGSAASSINSNKKNVKIKREKTRVLRKDGE